MKTAAIRIDGRAMADAWLADISIQVRALGAPLGLAAVCPARDDALGSFVRLKQKAAQSVGIEFSSYFVDSEAAAAETIRFLATDESVQGIFVELPLPESWDQRRMLALIPPEKDVDALSVSRTHAVPEPAVVALRRILDGQGIALPGLRVVVIGQGMLVGAPAARWLREQGAQVDVIDIDTPEPAAVARHADLLVTGVGKPGLVTADWIRGGATVIDFGWKDGRGDVDAGSAKRKAVAYTPVPGGTGPLVVAAVMQNLVTLATRSS